MIKLDRTGCCISCPNIDLELKKDVLYGGNFSVEIVYTLRCVHDQVCGDLKQEKESDNK